MNGKYSIDRNGSVVGYAEVKTKGLYMCISSRCKLDRFAFYRLIAVWDDVCLDLGTYLPDGDSFAINTKLPIKKSGNGMLSFKIEEKDAKRLFEALLEGKKLLHLQKLDDARYCEKYGTYGLEFLT